LIYKRGYGKVNKQRIALSSNQIIEENLGQYGILSIEDIIHEIQSAGPHFKQVSKYVSSNSDHFPKFSLFSPQKKKEKRL